ncbi:alpha-amylase family glycosyl hydrolase [Streptomyces sp. NRRL S-1813]|uniref:alpha-amylase family glycosyl hydrolase n=1 Tax=Streptomyces sp. NRRL S-1813 TaxID=1463888 RepID=UPI0004CB954B|nr:alpha-amylase family glycosyl hydrolase [Streptomyces sp. NRRL S-1813]
MTQELTSPSPAPQAPGTGRGPGWWRDAVIYQVYVRSFADSDGDGIGDLRGARERLPYLRDLGVDAVWLTPFYASPQADGGYDVADYRAVDPLFGTLQDADDLIRAAHDLGLRVIVDIVPNHTSDRHPWFQDPVLARQRYLFRPGKGESGELPPNDWESVFGGPAWTRTDHGDWYLHLFAPEQPDLNWDNPEVHAEFEAIMRFWLDLGVDGFRVDVAHGMIKAPGLPDIGHGAQAQLIGAQVLPFFDQDGVHAIHRAWRRLLDGYGDARGKQVIGVAEAWAPTGAATLLMLALPGSAYLYQGEELGLPEVTDLPDEARQDPAFFRGGRATGAAGPGTDTESAPDGVAAGGQDGFRDGCRVPLPWSGELPPYGFGPGGSWLPQPAGWGGLTVAAQTGDPASTLELYRAALELRRRLPGLGDGPMSWAPAPDGVLAFTRPGLLCTVNTLGHDVGLPAPGTPLLSSAPVTVDDATAQLPGDSCTWWAI